MQNKRLVLLAGQWDTTPIVYNFLQKHFDVAHVVMEQPVSKKIFLKNRAKRLGFMIVIGQILFSALVAKPMRRLSNKRVREILTQYSLNKTIIPAEKTTNVVSVNSQESMNKLKSLQPDLIVVHGTRIISKKVLTSLTGTSFLNIHAGITPRYRGSHGAYWALLNNDKENCGVTVHLVDAGIDTGNILQQKEILPTTKDNFTTYPYLQLAEGLLLLKQVIPEVLHCTIRPQKNTLDSRLWHHPTLWGYLYNRLRRGVK